jgi:hypothetical protein
VKKLRFVEPVMARLYLEDPATRSSTVRDVRFSQPCSRGSISSGIRHCIVGWVNPNVVNERSIFILNGHEVWLDLLTPEDKSRYRCAPVSTGDTFQDLPRLRETADNTERYI